jgi:hypothetical protein
MPQPLSGLKNLTVPCAMTAGSAGQICIVTVRTTHHLPLVVSPGEHDPQSPGWVAAGARSGQGSFAAGNWFSTLSRKRSPE